jgi:hypothetical protein
VPGREASGAERAKDSGHIGPVGKQAEHDELLPDGRMTTGLVRRGDRVLRPMGRWSASVHEYLRYLEAAGFGGAPRILGTEGDREILSLLEGDVPLDPSWQPGHGYCLPPYARTEAALRGAAVLLRELHNTAAGFHPALVSYRFHPHPPRSGEVVSHGDVGPWNTVYRKGVPAALIDWDGAQPVEPLVELASAAWAFVPLGPPEELAGAGFDPLPDLPHRLRLFVDAYDLSDRQMVLPALERSVLATAERVQYFEIGPADAATTLSYLVQKLRWLGDALPSLASAL